MVCSICTIPEREELLYRDKDIFLVQTKDLKGHNFRVMACIHEHRSSPTFTELSKAYSVVIDYMSRVMKGQEWLLVEGTFASIPEHWHLIVSDALGTPEELEALRKTPTVSMPITTQKIMIGIPAFNEELTITAVIAKAQRYGKVYVVNDGSTDNTFKRARGADFVYSSEHNRGYGASVGHLFKEAKAKDVDVLITLDADGQHDPDEIPLLLNALNTSDVVVGNRFLGKTNMPKYRQLGVKFISGLVKLGDSQCGFRAYNKQAINSIKITETGMGASLEILRRIQEQNLRVSEVPVTITYEDTSHSQNPVRHGISLMETFFWGGIWKNPFNFLALPAMLSIAMGVIFSIWLLVEYSQTRWFPPSLASLSLGFTLLGIMLGITYIFVYVGKRILEELR